MDTDKRQFHFGMIAIEKGYVTADQVMKALDEQIEEEQSTGSHSWIGTILLEHGWITLAQHDDILQIMESARS